MSFTLRKSTAVDTLHLNVQEYVHEATGALHVHLAADDVQNAFLVAFRTVPEDSTGVAHILEHTSLCGSRRYPVRDPFFMMIRRSLNTFMNAFTASDWTAYPFATCNRKDFDNLLQVYLDAAFFPNLDQMDFLQEGHRLEFADMENPQSPLEFKGVVFNEMKGAMSSASSQLWQAISEHLFPTQTYHYNSGGDPAHIPDLTHEQLKAFHATHYHPGNAIFMTYGNIPAKEHQAVFEAQVLQHFTRSDLHIRVGEEQRFTAPKRVTCSYATEPGQPLARKTHIVVSWLLGKNTDAENVLTAHLLNGVLLDHGGSPLRKALEQSELGDAPSPMCGLCDSTLEMIFSCGFEGSEATHAEAAETLILDTLRQVAEHGVPFEDVAAQLHQLELSQREITGDGHPYGLSLMLHGLTPALHDAPIADVFDIDGILRKLGEKIRDPDFIRQQAQALLDNPHRVTLVMTPDAELAAKQEAAERQRLETIRANMSEDDVATVIAQARALKQRQETVDDPELLPKVTREDIPATVDYPQLQAQETVAGMRYSRYACPTNGLIYAELIADVPAMDEQAQTMLPLFVRMMDELGSGGRDYQQTQALQAAVTGGLSAFVSIRSDPEQADRYHSHFILSAKALQRHQQACLTLMRETLDALRLDESERMRELIAQARLRSERSVVSQGHVLAMRAAAARLNPLAAAEHQQSGLAGIQWLKALDQRIREDAGMVDMQHTLSRIYEALRHSTWQALFIGEQAALAELQQQASELWRGLPQTAPAEPLTLAAPASDEVVQQAWVTSTQVNFCARAWKAVGIEDEDAAALQVLAPFLRNNFLHRSIREQGGAYGGGAVFDPSTRTFRMFSYRDPRLQETLDDFQRAIDWMLQGGHEERLLEEAILGVIGRMDAPGSPAGEAASTFHRSLAGHTPERRQRRRQRVLEVTLNDLQRVSERWLTAQAHTAVVTDRATAETLPDMKIIAL